ncbi:MAG: SDR family oxidoreductase [Solirubrobacteraceae bacterium]
MNVPAESNPPSEYQPILITGVTGFVGMEVMARFLQRSQRHIFALIRARTTPPTTSACARCWLPRSAIPMPIPAV